VREWPEIEEMLRRWEVKWLLRELAVLAITVLVVTPLLILLGLCIPFSAMWSLVMEDDRCEK
jgi:hypothetical protein